MRVRRRVAMPGEMFGRREDALRLNSRDERGDETGDLLRVSAGQPSPRGPPPRAGAVRE